MADFYLTVNTLRLDRAGFCKGRDITDLLGQGPLRGEDFVAQGVAGRTFRTKTQDELVAQCSFVVFGLNNKDGTPYADRFVGLRENIEQIRTSCIDGSASSLVTATLTFPDASTTSASVYCRRLATNLYGDLRNGAAMGLIMEIVVPAGEFT